MLLSLVFNRAGEIISARGTGDRIREKSADCRTFCAPCPSADPRRPEQWTRRFAAEERNAYLLRMKKAGRVHTGTSGWSYKHWKGPFYPEDLPDKHLFSYYSRFFRSVEINSSFYHLPLKKTFENWKDASPGDFIFAVKASRYITHIKKLKDAGQAVERFFERAVGLGGKTGPILFQLPPSLKMNLERLDSFFDELPKGYLHTFEFRNQSWFHPEVYSLLSDRGAAFCIYELGGRSSPIEVTADFVYVRLHGPGGPYQGAYSESALALWRERFRKWNEEGRDVYCYFDNDEKGFAAQNAMELQRLLGL